MGFPERPNLDGKSFGEPQIGNARGRSGRLLMRFAEARPEVTTHGGQEQPATRCCNCGRSSTRARSANSPTASCSSGSPPAAVNRESWPLPTRRAPRAVCRARLSFGLRDEHAAEDAFQATFLALARKAGSLWAQDSLAPWLHQAAYRAAVHDRSSNIRRRSHEHAAAAPDPNRWRRHAVPTRRPREDHP